MGASLSLSDILVAGLASSAVLIGLALIANEWLAERREDRERAAAYARRRALRTAATGHPTAPHGHPAVWQVGEHITLDGAGRSACDASSSAGSDSGSCGGGE